VSELNNIKEQHQKQRESIIQRHKNELKDFDSRSQLELSIIKDKHEILENKVRYEKSELILAVENEIVNLQLVILNCPYCKKDFMAKEIRDNKLCVACPDHKCSRCEVAVAEDQLCYGCNLVYICSNCVSARCVDHYGFCNDCTYDKGITTCDCCGFCSICAEKSDGCCKDHRMGLCGCRS